MVLAYMKSRDKKPKVPPRVGSDEDMNVALKAARRVSLVREEVVGPFFRSTVLQFDANKLTLGRFKRTLGEPRVVRPIGRPEFSEEFGRLMGRDFSHLADDYSFMKPFGDVYLVGDLVRYTDRKSKPFGQMRLMSQSWGEWEEANFG